jgi:hypothetical protein
MEHTGGTLLYLSSNGEGNCCFDHERLMSLIVDTFSITTGQGVRFPISPLIYGVNFPTDANQIQNLGIKLSRWGGNAMTGMWDL